MKVHGQPMRTIWVEPDGWSVGIIDQTRLPHAFVTARLATMEAVAHAITSMQLRGAPLIGAAAAYFGAVMGGNHRDKQVVIEGWVKPWR